MMVREEEVASQVVAEDEVVPVVVPVVDLEVEVEEVAVEEEAVLEEEKEVPVEE